jgi:hypothetical protein
MYKHTQTGWVIIISFIIMFLLLGFFIGPLAGKAPFIIAVAVSVLVLLLLFGTLTVEVSNDLIRLAFGIGLIRYKFQMNDIASAKIRRIKWYSGFGIHGWPGKGWLLNVSGLDTVELTMKNGMRYLIGTDEPQQLYDAIRINIKQ